MNVLDVHTVLDRIEAKWVSGADRLATTHPATGHPDRESGGVMVSAIALFAHGSAAKLAPPDHQRIVEEAALAQICKKSCDRLVHGLTQAGVVRFDACVGIPFAAGAVVELYEPNTAFDEPAGQQTIFSEGRCRLVFESIECFRGRRFPRQVDRLWSLGLHSKGKFVAGDPGIQFRLLRIPVSERPIKILQERKFFALFQGRRTFWRIQIGDGFLARSANPHTLVRCGHETATPVP